MKNPPTILVVDDNPAIHEDFRKLFAAVEPERGELVEMEESLFGDAPRSRLCERFELRFASQGEQALEMIRAAREFGDPIAMAFVDIRMPPGWDGVEAIENIWWADPDVQIVLCTAYSDYSWDEIRRRLGNCDGLLVLKKPFDPVEVLQMAHTLTRKWELTREVRASVELLERKVAERTAALECEMSNRARVEEQLRQSQKLDAVGQLAAGIAHDFNNLLTIIHGNAGLLLGSTEDGRSAADSLGQIVLAAERGTALTRQLLLFSRQRVEESRPIDVNGILAEVSGMLRRILGAPIDMTVAPADQPMCVVADEAGLTQIIMNLALNARDAMPSGGLLTLRTSLAEFWPEQVASRPQARPGTFVCLTVADTGCGMDHATLARIFEPFFTTKEAGKGTGLGLATVYGVVRQHQGWIEVASEPGKGTTFQVYLPRFGNALPETGQTEFSFNARARPGSRSTVLLVEDDSGVREFVRAVLSLHGYTVIEAGDGVAALEIWRVHADEVDVLLTDMVMPNGITGRGLAERFRAEQPGLKVIYASGYGSGVVGSGWLDASGTAFLEKPFTVESLLRTVAETARSGNAKPPVAP